MNSKEGDEEVMNEAQRMRLKSVREQRQDEAQAKLTKVDSGACSDLGGWRSRCNSCEGKGWSSSLRVLLQIRRKCLL